MHKNKTEETAADHLEFNEMFRRNEAIVYNFIRYRILDKSLAQDVMQETFYLAYKKWDILKDHPNQTGWLLETARHKIQEFNRKIKKLECETSLDDHDDHEHVVAKDEYGCEFPYKSRVMGTSEPLKPLKAPYMARNPVKWVFFRLKGQEIPLKI